MSDIDFQNGFIVGMATRGLTVNREVVAGETTIVKVCPGIISTIAIDDLTLISATLIGISATIQDLYANLSVSGSMSCAAYILT